MLSPVSPAGSEECRVCGGGAVPVFSARVLGKYSVWYFRCGGCGLLQTESPFWLEEAYRNPINAMDTGVLARNLYLSEKAAAILYSFFSPDGKYLDYAGGYGIFVRRMRDIGFGFYWHDRHSPNLLAKGFDYDGSGGIEVVTCFEAFEHFVHPVQELEKILAVSRNVLFSTLLLPDPVPAPAQWWYYAAEHGQHIAFYTLATLRWMAAQRGLCLCSDGKSLHLLTERPIPDRLFRKTLDRASSIVRKNRKRTPSKTEEDMERMRERMGDAAGRATELARPTRCRADDSGA